MKNKIWMLTALLMFAIGQVSAAEKITYYHLDALGSPIAATDENGQLAWKEAYKPYGERIRKEDGGSNSTWYTGKQEDEDNGLTYFGARWYDPAVGRFMGIDPVGVQEENIHSFNRYAYANNNPYTFVDPDGRSPAFVDAYLVENAQATAMGYDIYTRAGAQAVLDLGVESATLQAEVMSLMGGGAGALGLKGLGKGGAKGADNIANGSKLANQLRLQSARSPFNSSGGLTQDAIKNSTKIIDSSQIKNTAIPKGFSKYTTETFQSPSGNFQTHFYRNDKTGGAFYGQDYKAIFNSRSGSR